MTITVVENGVTRLVSDRELDAVAVQGIVGTPARSDDLSRDVLSETIRYPEIAALMEQYRQDRAGTGEAIQMEPLELDPVVQLPTRLVGKPRLASLLFNRPLLLDRSWIQPIYDIADSGMADLANVPGNGRSLAYQRGEVYGLERTRGNALPGATNVRVRDGIATLAIDGVIIPKASFFAEMSGAQSLRSIALDFNAALDAPHVRGILLAIDSPGGSADAIEEMAAMIRAGAEKKPVWAYSGSLMASAAYWLGSAASRIVVGRTTSVGSIGTVAIVPTGDDDGYVEIVSTQSPKKRLDPESDEGREEIQTHVDQLSDIFVESVAANRGVTVETVLADFGQGGLLLGERAVVAGMADAIGSYESTLADLVAHVDRTERSARMASPVASAEPTTELAANELPIDARYAEMERELAASRERTATLEREQAASTAAHFEQSVRTLAKEKGWVGADADLILVATALRPDGKDTPAYAAFVRTMHAAAAQEHIGEIFRQEGIGGIESSASPLDEVRARAAAAIAASNGALSYDQACAQLFKADPKLEARYDKAVQRLNRERKPADE